MTRHRIIGGILLVVGCLGAIVYLLGLIDPAGAQLSVDGDPFGVPPPWQHGVIGLVISFAVAGLGAVLVYRQSTSPPHRSDAGRLAGRDHE